MYMLCLGSSLSEAWDTVGRVVETGSNGRLLCLVLLLLTGAVVSLKWLTEDIGEEVQGVAFMVNVQLSQRLTNDSLSSA